MARFAVIGCGNAGAAVAAHLTLLGETATLYDIADNQLAPIIANDNTITLQGNIDVTGAAKIALVTKDLGEAVDGAELIICTTAAHVHKHVARDLIPHLKDGQIILLNPGRTGGVLEFQKIFREGGCKADVLVVESQTILYACRREGAVVNIFGKKKRVACSGLPGAELPRFEKIIQRVFPEFVLAEGGIWATSLDNIGMLFHPTPTLLNLGRMESGQPFDYYIDGFSPSIAALVEELDKERLQVGRALGVELPSAVQWLETTYGAKGENLYQALQNNVSYQGIKAPMFKEVGDKMGLRYVIEDVPTGLVPFAELGQKFGVETPAIRSIINLANVIYKTDFVAGGRSLDQLGLQEMSIGEIRNLS